MPAPVITALPTPPSRTQPAVFAERADAFLGAFPTLRTQINSLATWLDTTSTNAITAAETARDAAIGARDTALTYRNTANTYATNANASKNAAATSATNAATSATNAANSATSAGNSATSANASKNAAATSETNAATSATNAGNSATSANASKNAAATSATDAANSATSASSSLTALGRKWYGALASAPTGSIDNGALFFNTTTNDLNVYKDGSWVNAVTQSFSDLVRRNITQVQKTQGPVEFTTYSGVHAPSPSANATFYLKSSDGSEKARLIWVAADESLVIQVWNSASNSWSSLKMAPNGVLTVNNVPIPSLNDLITANNIGPQSVFCRSAVTVSYGGNVAGSQLTVAGITSTGALHIGATTFTGTWQARGTAPAGGCTNFVRIA